MRTALMDGNPVALLLRSNYLSLLRDNGIHTGGDILNRNVDTTLRPIAVEGLYGEAGKLKDGLTYRLAGDCAGMNAYAAHHGGPVDHGDALARLCRGDGALLARWTTADFNKVVSGRTHFEGLKSTMPGALVFCSSRYELTFDFPPSRPGQRRRENKSEFVPARAENQCSWHCGFEALKVSASAYDLVVIGSGPAGQKGAIAAAKARKRVAVIDRTTMMGGVSVHTGTIPSKTVREAIFQLTGLAVKALYGNGSPSRVDISIQDVSSRVNAIVARETEVIRAQLKRNGIAVHQGSAHFLDPYTMEVQGDGEGIRVEAAKILIACGTRPAHSPEIPFDNHRIVDTDHLSGLGSLPKEAIVVGAGVVGLEYASFMAALGADVPLIDQRPMVLEFVDREIVEAPFYPLRPLGLTFTLR